MIEGVGALGAGTVTCLGVGCLIVTCTGVDTLLGTVKAMGFQCYDPTQWNGLLYFHPTTGVLLKAPESTPIQGTVTDAVYAQDCTNAEQAERAVNIKGGVIGSIPYQFDTDLTSLLPIGSVNNLLRSDGELPRWTSTIVLDQASLKNNLGDTLAALRLEGSVSSPAIYSLIIGRSDHGSWVQSSTSRDNLHQFVTGAKITTIGQKASSGTFEISSDSSISLKPAGEIILEKATLKSRTLLSTNAAGNIVGFTASSNSVLTVSPAGALTSTTAASDDWFLVSDTVSGHAFKNPTFLAVGNLLGGTAGRIPYQTAANTTAFLPLGTSNQILQGTAWTSNVTTSTLVLSGNTNTLYTLDVSSPAVGISPIVSRVSSAVTAALQIIKTGDTSDSLIKFSHGAANSSIGTKANTQDFYVTSDRKIVLDSVVGTYIPSELNRPLLRTDASGRITSVTTLNNSVLTTSSSGAVQSTTGTDGWVLTANSSTPPSFKDPATISFGSATNALTANSLVGGSAGTIPYQSASSTTAMLTAGTSGQVLKCNGAAAPSWTSILEPTSIRVNGTPPFTSTVSITGPSSGTNPALAIIRAAGDSGTDAIVIQKDASITKTSLCTFKGTNNPGTSESYIGVESDDVFVVNGFNRDLYLKGKDNLTLHADAFKLKSDANSFTSAPMLGTDSDGNLTRASLTPFNITAADVGGQIAQIPPGTADQVLTSNGPSTLPSFKTVINTGPQIFTYGFVFGTHQTHTFSPQCKWFEYWITGGGGSGGYGIDSSGSRTYAFTGSAGGGGGTVYVKSSTIPLPYLEFYVGQGGAARTSLADGIPGEDSYIYDASFTTTTHIARGGGGGSTGAGFGYGGLGGDCVNGTLRYRGGDGDSSHVRPVLWPSSTHIVPADALYAKGGASYFQPGRGVGAAMNGSGGGSTTNVSKAGGNGLMVIYEHYV